MNQAYKVVVAEDEELQMESLVRKIHKTDLGFQVIGRAANGVQALELVEKHMPDLLITDIRMPTMTGIELIENLSTYYPFVHVVIISGFSDFNYAKSAIKHGVNDYLLKPVDTDELINALRNIRHKLNLQKSGEELADYSATVSKEEAVIILHDHIAKNYKSEINLNRLAESIHYSPSYLTRLFLQKYNMPPQKYIIQLRVKKAQTLLLRTPPLSIKQIGEEIGYPEQGYFSRIFKKTTGMSPLDYRASTMN